MEKFADYVKDFIKNTLPEYEGCTVCACDLGWNITESINADGTATYNRHEAMEYLKEWWWDVADAYEYQKFNYGEVLHNPFENPEAFMVCMIIDAVNTALARCDVINDAWNDEVELTEEVISTILDSVDNIPSDWKFF